MADEFDLSELAAYLHLDPVRVRRMAERGKIPGRRVGGDWRFHPAEIHHWLEERILDGDEEEQERLEEVLANQDQAVSSEELSIETLLTPEAMAVPLKARTKRSVISTLVEVAARTGYLWDPDKMTEAVAQREELFPTAVEGGLALLHPRRPMPTILGAPFLAFGRTDRGIPFGAPDGGLTDLFFLILSVDDKGHLRTLARLGRVLGARDMIDQVREAPTAGAVRDLLLAAEREATA